MTARHLLNVRRLVLAVVFVTIARHGAAAEPNVVDRTAIVQDAVYDNERFWTRIAQDEPYPTMGIRKIFSYALALCEARRHPERLERLFELAAREQDRDPQSPGYGNFQWTWWDDQVTDRNAVEFCMQDAVVIWRNHRDWVPDAARRSLEEMLRFSVEGCLRHRVPTGYTNIAILNAGNLIVLGESLKLPEAADVGYRRLEAVCLWTWRFGTREYCSPTYYGTDLDGLLLIEAMARRESGQEQARALLEFFWTDIALNWFPAGQCLAGSQSRSYDYLHGLGNFDRHPWLHGWLEDERPAAMGMLRPLAGQWSPPERLRTMNLQRLPRLIRQSWGVSLGESRTHMMHADVTLGSSSALYGAQDMPLTVDLAGFRRFVRCYFLPDGRNDPYGKKRYSTSSAGHMKALHLKPFWAAAQQTCDAVGLVVYRDEDLQEENVVDLQSHFVFRRDVDELRVGGRPITRVADWPPGTPDEPTRLELAPGEPVVFRVGSAAVGVRVVWSRGQDGQAAVAALVDDGNPHRALRLTVAHWSEDTKLAPAGAALWVRVGSRLDDDAFLAWSKRFEAADSSRVNVSDGSIQIGVPGEEGPVAIGATAGFGSGADVRFVPEPTRAALELDGEDIGRPLLETIESVAAFRNRARSVQAINVPAAGNVSWEAEQGLVVPGMTVGNDTQASGKRFVWQTGENTWSRDGGGVTWPLEVARTGRYWLWARVFAPTPEDDSFYVHATESTADFAPPPRRETAAWHTGQTSSWQWIPLKLNRVKKPTPLELQAGRVYLQFGVREPGTKLDRLMITSDPNAKPK